MGGIMLAEAVELSNVVTIFSTAIDGVKTDAMQMIITAAPVALSLAGVLLALRIGWRAFKALG